MLSRFILTCIVYKISAVYLHEYLFVCAMRWSIRETMHDY